MIESPDDKLTIKNLKEGDVLSFDKIFNKYNRKVYYFAKSYLKSKEEAEDVVQNVFLNIWKYRDQINEYYVFSRYLFKITYTETCKRFRKQASSRKHFEEMLQNLSLEDNSTDLDIEFNDLQKTVSKLIDNLPSRQRVIFLFSVKDQLTNDQIAQKLNISKKTVDNYLARAKTFIRKTLSDGSILPTLFICLFLK